MKKTINHLIIGLFAVGTVSMLGACKKDNNTGGGSNDAQLAFTMTANNALTTLSSADNSLAVNAAASGSITWTSGVANVNAFKLEAKKRSLEIEITSRNLTSINLFALDPASISAAIDTGTYREIELKVLLTKTSGTNIPLTLKGSYTSPGGTTTPIEFYFNDDAVIKVEAENVTVDGQTDLVAAAKLDVKKLISGASAALDAATRTNGVIVISSSSNVNIYNVIKANVSNCGGWGGFSRHNRGERK